MTSAKGFSKPDVVRAIQAVQKAGLEVAEVRVHPDGGFSVLTTHSDKVEEHNPWDDPDDDD
ncbi:hypothetical protein [Pelagibius sp. Alg239-R121]|uniref:hypothetical protein n=1 Tax=Pelagibius sp. Alg239-R121 TaxID=2993448 RepID=UPI0024A65BB8|nr:hypothetical protein [Pelagibius sp. Alg239-R121]